MKKTKYPKIITLLLIYIIVFYIFSFSAEIFEVFLENLSYFGIFLSGALYTYAFTASIGTAAFLVLSNFYHPILIALIAGIGAAVADLSKLKFLEKFNFEDELKQLSREKLFRIFRLRIFHSKLFLTICGLIAMGSPLPNELGILLISKGKMLSVKNLFIISLITNTVGVYIISIL